mmetsp:Transcript_30872/g.81811  ORF Transcript_30872/g.81811 Transcript_30872/m.81811 type:complete len:241 (+) Transcript_30872:35-757(+)
MLRIAVRTALICSLLGLAAALREPRLVVSRRSAAALLGPAVWLPAGRARAGLFDQGPLTELGGLRGVRDRLDELSKQLENGFGDSEDDAIVVLRTSSVYFNGVSKTMSKTVEVMPLLTSEERSAALAASAKFGEGIVSLNEACREQSSKAQLAASKSASGALAEYLSVASVHYSVPNFKPMPYSSDKNEFAAQYFGFFSCEGQGLERIPGSNSCKDPPKKPKGDSKAFKLDFDFLTGKKL